MTAPAPNPDRVDLGDAGSVDLWVRSLGISRDDLERAVGAVGDSTGAVYDYLARQRTGSANGPGPHGKR